MTMKTIKVAEATGAVLDWLVAKCEEGEEVAEDWHPYFWVRGGRCFQIVDDDSEQCSYLTFDEALMAAICSKYDSHETAPFVWRLLRGKE